MSYKGKITTVGSSEGIRLEKDLFRQNPEFQQAANVRADIIGPGKMLISVVDRPNVKDEDDPLVGAFLSFIEKSISTEPTSVTPLDETMIARAKALTANISTSDEDFE